MQASLKLFRPTLSWKILAAAAAAVLILLVPPPQPTAPTTRYYRVEASSFAYAPAILHANPGDTITIELVATDVVHGLSIDGYPDLYLTADPGQSASFTFVAGRAGTFRIRCVVPCGNLHPFMLGKFQVGPNMLFIRAALLALLAGVSIWIGAKQ